MVGDLCILPVSNSQKGFFQGKIFPILNESRKIKLDYSLAYFQLGPSSMTSKLKGEGEEDEEDVQKKHCNFQQ